MYIKKIKLSIILGSIAGIIDSIPMVVQKLSWDAIISAFSLWVIVSFFIATSTIKLQRIWKGVLIAFLVLFPSAILIAWKEPLSLIPIGFMTVILGAFLGFFIPTGDEKRLKNNGNAKKL